MLALPGDRRRLLPHLLLFVVVLIWSSNTVVSKIALREASPALLALVRISMAVLPFHLPILLLFLRHGPPLKPAEWRRLVLIGTIGAGGSATVYTFALSMTPATYAGLMQMTGPPLTALLAWLALGERMGRDRAIGTAIAFAGAGLLATNGQLADPDPAILAGSGLIVGSQVAWAYYTLASKPLLARRPPLLILAGSHVFALFSLWPATGLLGAWAELPTLADWSWGLWAGVAYLAFGTTALSQVMYIYALRELPAAQAISYTYLQPVLTALLAALVLGEQPSVLTLVCGGTILFGLWLVNRPRRPARP
jgi:drug/metabolite transporter (DMT)-like permease